MVLILNRTSVNALDNQTWPILLKEIPVPTPDFSNHTTINTTTNTTTNMSGNGTNMTNNTGMMQVFKTNLDKNPMIKYLFYGVIILAGLIIVYLIVMTLRKKEIINFDGEFADWGIKNYW
jgi:hypothetical protein